jgi:hypothetical protein
MSTQNYNYIIIYIYLELYFWNQLTIKKKVEFIGIL